MKKIIICAMILVVSAHSFGQEINPPHQLTSQDYMAKSKKQKTKGWIFLGGGATLVITSVLLYANSVKFPGTLLGLMNLTGLGMMCACLPVFTHAMQNKKKALAISGSFKMESAPIIQKNSSVQTSFPALSVKFDLG